MIDSHAHLDMESFDSDREEVLRRAEQAGVERILSVGMLDEKASYRKTFELIEGREELHTAVGCHPHDSRLFTEVTDSLIPKLATHPKLLAIGEIGLDYHYNLSPRDAQRRVFRRQIQIARALELPIIIHHREAESDLLEIVRDEKASEVGGIVHSFTSDLETAESMVRLGFLISFSGILTFKNASALREVARRLPLDRILVETDCPYLAPVPFRGKRNEPAFVRETASVLAQTRAVSLGEVEKKTDENFRRLFRL